jgi:Flagellar hook-length control protein FliK
MIPIDIAGAAPGTSSRTNGAPDNAPDAKLDEGFRKLLGKLSGQRNAARETPLEEDRERPAAKRPATVIHGRKIEKDTHASVGGMSETDARADAPAELPPDRASDGFPQQAADRGDVQSQSLPGLLQVLPPKAAAKTAVANSATPVAGSHKPGADVSHPNAGTDDVKSDSGRDPFAALTSLLAREDYGTGPKLADTIDRPVEPPKITVISKETHFEPVIRAAPAQQVADAVLGEILSQDDTARAPAAADIDHLSLRTQSDGPLKILHIRLEPNNLGEVSIKMRLVGGALELHLEASRTETAEMLLKDKDFLNRILRTSGYAPDVVTIQASADSNASTNQNNNGSPQHSSTAQNGAQPEGRRGNGSTGEQNPMPDKDRPN